METRKELSYWLAHLEKEYQVSFTKENYWSLIIKDLDRPKSLIEYMERYREEHREEITLEWGVFFFLLIQAHREKDVEKMEEFYGYIEDSPANYLVEMQRGEIAMHYYGEPFKALALFKKANELKPKDPHVLYNIAFVYSYLFIIDRAKSYYSMALKEAHKAHHPVNLKSQTFYNYGILCIKEGDIDTALELFKKALKVRPDYVMAKEAVKSAELMKKEGKNYVSNEKELLVSILNRLNKI